MPRVIIPAILIIALLTVLAACGGDDPTATAAPTPTPAPTATPVPPPPAPTPTAMPDATPAPQPTDTPAPTAAAPAAVIATAMPEPTPIPPTATPMATATPSPTGPQTLEEYAATVAGGPGAIAVGDPTSPDFYAQLIGPPVHDGMYILPEGALRDVQFPVLYQVGLFGDPGSGVPGHQFIYTSDYYRELLEKANLLNPTEVTSSGENIEIQHVCLTRIAPTCVIMQAYLAPQLAARTNGQVTLSVTSFAELSGTGGAGIVQDTLNLVGDGTLDMVNIYTGYVSGALPAIEVQSLWGMGPDWETTYLALADMIPDIERMLEAETGGVVINRNWYAGADQWFFSDAPINSVADFEGKKVRSHSNALSSLIRGLGGEPLFIPPGADYVAMERGTVDIGTTAVLFALGSNYHEVSEYMTGPVIGFGYTTNVISNAKWETIPDDIRQIIIEEGAKAELEALRIAPYHNVVTVVANQAQGIQPIPFSMETILHIAGVVLPENVIPDWLNRLGYPERNQDAVRIFNEHAGPYIGLRIADDGSVERAPITKGPRAQ